MEVSLSHGGTPSFSSILVGVSPINQLFWGYPQFRKTPIWEPNYLVLTFGVLGDRQLALIHLWGSSCPLFIKEFKADIWFLKYDLGSIWALKMGPIWTLQLLQEEMLLGEEGE